VKTGEISGLYIAQVK